MSCFDTTADLYEILVLLSRLKSLESSLSLKNTNV